MGSFKLKINQFISEVNTNINIIHNSVIKNVANFYLKI